MLAASVNTPAATSIVTSPEASGVSVAVYEVPLPVKLLNVPLVTVMSVVSKSVVDSLNVNVSGSVASFVVSPLTTLFDVIVIVDAVPSYVQVNWVAAVLLLPAESVNAFAATSMVAAPSAAGVNVAVYAALLPEKLLKVPLDTVTAFASKSVVDSLDVNVSDSVASFVVVPLLTAPAEESTAVIVITGAVES